MVQSCDASTLLASVEIIRNRSLPGLERALVIYAVVFVFNV